ncbi:PRAME family member 12-like [Alexandromys fortis]|uniref:PRAME family member 12-like n=1 Tax=Alexandromys fortis TaxID=100897 RepID=UPI0021520B69|nr:PRAME family member 12-like [Microtus fortis]
MSLQEMPTLQHLAIQGLLRNEDLVISSLENLPTVFFPPLFKQAFINRQARIVTAMVISWPFSSLPLGALIEYAQSDNFQAVLNGIDFLCNQSVWPSRCRLHTLNLQQIHHDFWEGCPGPQYRDNSPETKRGEIDPKTGRRKPLMKVLAEYTILYVVLKDYSSFFMEWLKVRRYTVPSYFFRLVRKRK